MITEFELPRLPSGKVDIEAWAEQLGVKPITDISEFAIIWPNDEPVDEFLNARRAWRAECQ
jgi:hypothetical protein